MQIVFSLTHRDNIDCCNWPCGAFGSEFNCRSRVESSIPARSHTFVEIDHEILSTAILFLPLIQEGLLSVTSMCSNYWIAEESTLHKKNVVR